MILNMSSKSRLFHWSVAIILFVSSCSVIECSCITCNVSSDAEHCNKTIDDGYMLPEDYNKISPSPSYVDCPPGYMPIFEQCYIILNGSYIPDEAVDACRKAGGTVAEVKDDRTNGAIYDLTGEEHTITIIGVRCGETCQDLESYGKSNQTFTAWEECEPSKHHEKCVVTNFKNHITRRRAQWNNIRCDTKTNNMTYQAACQIKAACPRVVLENLTFNRTNGGQTARSLETCNGAMSKAIPLAWRLCEEYSTLTSFWVPSTQIKLTNCSDVTVIHSDFQQVKSRDVTPDNVLDTSKELVTIATKNETILTQLGEVFSGITQINNTTYEITKNFVTALDKVITQLDRQDTETTSDTSTNQQFVEYLERQITNLQREKTSFNISTKTLEIVGYRLDKDLFTTGYDFNCTLRNKFMEIYFPPNVFEKSNLVESEFDSDKVALTVMEYLNPVLFENNVTRNDDTEYASNVMGITLEGRVVKKLPIKDPIKITFPMKHHIFNQSSSFTRLVYTCSFWDYEMNNNQGGWSSDGCYTFYVTHQSVECYCYHLTSLCVLVHEASNTVLDFLSKIGGLLSTVGLTITILFFIFVRKMRNKQPQKILLNLCIALLGFYLAFLYGIEVKEMDNKFMEWTVCASCAALIHYLGLASMAWMCVEALHMYLLFVKVSKTTGRYFLVKAGLFAWGLPVIPVGVSLAVWRMDYIAESYCFLGTGAGTHHGYGSGPLQLGFLPFLLLMFAFNLYCYVMIFQRLVFAKQMGSAKTSWQLAGMRFMNSVAIWTLLGMSWGFGFVSVVVYEMNPSKPVNAFDVLFCLSLSLKGFLVFLMFCVGNKEFRAMMSRFGFWFCRHGKQSSQISFPISLNYSDEKATNFMGHTSAPSRRTCSTATEDAI